MLTATSCFPEEHERGRRVFFVAASVMCLPGLDDYYNGKTMAMGENEGGISSERLPKISGLLNGAS